MEDEGLRETLERLESKLDSLESRVDDLETSIEETGEAEEPEEESKTPEEAAARPSDSLSDDWAEGVRRTLPESVRKRPHQKTVNYPWSGWRTEPAGVPQYSVRTQLGVAAVFMLAALVVFQAGGRKLVTLPRAGGIAVALGFAAIAVGYLRESKMRYSSTFLKIYGVLAGTLGFYVPHTFGESPDVPVDPVLGTATGMLLLATVSLMLGARKGSSLLSVLGFGLAYLSPTAVLQAGDAALGAAAVVTAVLVGFVHLSRWRAVAGTGVVAAYGAAYLAVDASTGVSTAYLALTLVAFSVVVLQLSTVNSRRLSFRQIQYFDGGLVVSNAAAFGVLAGSELSAEVSETAAAAVLLSAAALHGALILVKGDGRTGTVRAYIYASLALVAAAAAYGLPLPLALAAVGVVAMLFRASSGNLDELGLAGNRAVEAAAYLAALLWLLGTGLQLEGGLVTVAWASAAAAFVATGTFREADGLRTSGHGMMAVVVLKLIAFDLWFLDASVHVPLESKASAMVAAAAALNLTYGVVSTTDLTELESELPIHVSWLYVTSAVAVTAVALELVVGGVPASAGLVVYGMVAFFVARSRNLDDLTVASIAAVSTAALKLVLYDTRGGSVVGRLVLAVVLLASAAAARYLYMRYAEAIRRRLESSKESITGLLD